MLRVWNEQFLLYISDCNNTDNIDDCRDSPENVPTCIAYNASESRRMMHSWIKKKNVTRFKIVEPLVFILPPAAAVFDVNDTENARFQTEPA